MLFRSCTDARVTMGTKAAAGECVTDGGHTKIN